MTVSHAVSAKHRIKKKTADIYIKTAGFKNKLKERFYKQRLNRKKKNQRFKKFSKLKACHKELFYMQSPPASWLYQEKSMTDRWRVVSQIKPRIGLTLSDS